MTNHTTFVKLFNLSQDTTGLIGQSQSTCGANQPITGHHWTHQPITEHLSSYSNYHRTPQDSLTNHSAPVELFNRSQDTSRTR